MCFDHGEPWRPSLGTAQPSLVITGFCPTRSSLGISTIASYRCSQLFEAVGLEKELVDLCFNGVTTRIQGAGFTEFEQDLFNLSRLAWTKHKPIEHGGLLKYVHGGEYHTFNPDVVATLQTAVKSGNKNDYQSFVIIKHH